MLPDDGDLPVLTGAVVRHIILVERAVDELAVPVILPFDDLHDLTGAVLQLLGEHHDGVSLHHDLHQDLISHVVLALGKRHHPPVGGFGGIGVDGGHHSVPGTGAFRHGQGFLCGAHLAHADHVRVLAQDTL